MDEQEYQNRLRHINENAWGLISQLEELDEAGLLELTLAESPSLVCNLREILAKAPIEGVLDEPV